MALDYPILVFVQLGTARAPWLFKNMERTRALFPKNNLVLISDNQNFIRKASRMGFNTHFHKISDEIQIALTLNRNDQVFRENFWRFSLERLLAVALFHATIPNASVLHIESDVMLFSSFPLKELAKCKKPIWLSANETQDCAALFFLSSQSDARWFLEQALLNIRQDPLITDMKLLRAIRLDNPKRVELFPTSSKEVFRITQESRVDRFNQITKMSSYFGGIFDVAGIGIWLTGINPRNTGGRVLRYDNSVTGDNVFSASSFAFRDSCLQVNASPSIRVHCLHIHSKNEVLLSTRGDKLLQRMIDESSTLRRGSRFSLKGWVASAYDIHQSVGGRFFITFALLLRLDILLTKLFAICPIQLRNFVKGRGKY